MKRGEIMHTPYLIQRLKKPFTKKPKTPLDVLRKFGLFSSGLSPEAKEVISEICVFDYMGSSEYEFGAIPKALTKIIKQDLISFNITVPFSHKSFTKDNIISGERKIFIICPKAIKEEVSDYIRKIGNEDERCKERTSFRASLASREFDRNIFGWFDIENLFMFFKDHRMFNAWKAILLKKEG
jgi:hypothetical protein